MTGAGILVLGMDIAHTPATWLNDCRTLQHFFVNTRVNSMAPADSLAGKPGEYVMTGPGGSFIIYSAHARQKLGIGKIEPGTYDLRWLDCISGKTYDTPGLVLRSGRHLWNVPQGFGEELALYGERKDRSPGQEENAVRSIKDEEQNQLNTAPVAENSTVEIKTGDKAYLQLSFRDPDGGPGPYTVTIVSGPEHGTLTGTGNDRYYEPGEGYTGNDRITWRVNDGKDDSGPGVIRIHVK